MNAVESFDPGCGFLSPAEIDDALNGRLPESRFAEFDGHVEQGCAECVTLAADLELFRTVEADGPLAIERREDDAHAAAFRERLRREVRAVHPATARAAAGSGSRGWTFGWSWALGAAATLLVAVGAWFALRGSGGIPGSLSIPLPDGGSYVAQVKEFGAPPVLRGEPDVQSLWSEAEAAYVSGDFETAERALAAILERVPDSLDALIYRGVSLLALGRSAEAREALAAARTAALREDASTTGIDWFAALAALSAGEQAEARSFLRQATEGDGAYAEPARDLLRRLD